MLRRSLKVSTSALSAFVLATGGLALIPASASAADATAPVVIDEVFGGGGNAGAPVRHDFVELHNVSPQPVDLAGWSVQYASATGTGWAVTPLRGTLPAGTSYLVRGAAGANTTAPAVVGDVDGTLALGGTAGKVALVRTATTLTCGADCDGAAGVVDFVGYGAANDFLGAAPTVAPSNTSSVARTNHVNTAQNGADFSPTAPGPTACGPACAPPPPPPPADAVAKTIAEVQGTGDVSPLVGTRVVTEGVVTAAYPTGGLRGFFLQTAGTGGPTDPAARGASDGVFVFSSSGELPASVAVGKAVRVTGTVAEFFGLTQLSTTAAEVVEVAEPLAPVTASTTTSWPATPSQRESLEGMLYRPTGDYTVTNTFSTGQFGEVGLAAGTTPLIQPTEVGRPGSPEKLAAEASNAARAVALDDGSTTDFTRAPGNAGTPAYVSQTAPVRVGAAVRFTRDVVVDFRNSTWKLQPTTPVVGPANTASPASFEDTRTPAPDAARIGDAELEVASFNVLNYFTTLGTDSTSCTAFRDRSGDGNTVNSGCDQRGAWDREDFARQQTKIVKAVNALDADVVGLLEIENSARLGEPTDEALLSLVAALNADAGADVWAANPSSAELPAASGQDVITSAIIYKPAAVERVGAARALGDQSETGQAFQNAREPIGQVFTPKGGGDPFLFVVNHFKSKGSPGPWAGDVDAGDGQGSSNESRVRQAKALRDWVPTVLPAGVKGVALVGDFNAYSQEDPMHVLYDAGYVDAEAAFGAKEWSYSFSGLSGSLDHVLLNGVARGRATGADIWNINSGEALALEYSRYNTSATDFHRADPYRSSDHDPVVVGLRAESAPTPVQVLATNDFHGRLTASGAEAGAAVLAGAVDQLRTAQPNTVFAAAGDLIGASTFESFISKDKPTLDALNEAGLEVSSVGNHEFDQGYDDLVNRVMKPYDATTNPYGGAAWQYLGANVRRAVDGSAALPETWTRDFGGITVGFVGAVTEHLPELVSPKGIEGLRVEPVVTHADRSAAALKAKGADVVVLLVHEGAATTQLSSAVDPSSDFGKIVTGVGPDVDAIVSGHTHLAYSHQVPVPAWERQERAVTTRPVVSAGQYGTNLNQLLFTLDPETERVVGVRAEVLPLVKVPGYPADAATKAVVDKAVAEATVLGAAKIGTATGPVTRAKLGNGTTENRGGESTLGNLVAEVQRSATAEPVFGGAQIAFMNPGGLRADLTTGSTFPADVTYRSAANVQPFANTLVNMRLTGAQVKTALEQQWQPATAARPFLRLGISKGFTYTYDPTAPAGSRITGMQLQGTPVTPTATYSVTVNSFLASGGDNFVAFAAGTGKRDSGQVDLQALVEHLEQGSVAPDLTQRSVGVAFPKDAPADHAPGSTVSFSLSSLVFSGPGDRKDATVRVSLGSTPVGEFPVDGTIGTAVTDEYGTAQVRFAVPAGTPAGRTTVTVTGTTTGTTATVPLAVRHAVRVLAPTSGQVVRAGTPVPVSFRLTDAAGKPVADSVARAMVSGSCAISVSLTGSQSVPATCPRYLADEQRFSATVLTKRGTGGPAALRLELRYPGLSPQVVSTPVTLR